MEVALSSNEDYMKHSLKLSAYKFLIYFGLPEFYQLNIELLLTGCGMEAIARSEARTISVQPELWLIKEI